MALIPEKIRFHIIDYSEGLEEVNRQVHIAEEFGGGSLASLPEGTRAEKKARRAAIQSAGQPILDAVNAHNEAHRRAGEAGTRLMRFEKIATDVSSNIFLGEDAGTLVERTIEEAKASFSQAEELVGTTNDALPSRLQTRH